MRASGTHVQVSVEHSNVFMGGGSETEELILDGETSTLFARFSHRINSCWQADATLAHFSHMGGFLDSPIEEWHRIFNLPNAQRNLSPVDELEYVYQVGDDVLRGVTSNEQGFGDIQFSVQRLHACTRGAPVWRVGAKLAVANDETFFSSGGNDFYIDWQSSRRRLRARLDGAMSFGVLLPGKANNLPEQNPVVGFGSFGLQYQWSRSGSIVAQLDWHSAFFDSELEELGRVAGQFTLAARKQFANSHQLELSFAEDIVTDTAPDFSVRVAYRHGF